MKKILIFVSLYFVFNLALGQEEQKIKEIRKVVESINLGSNYLVKKLDNDYFVDKKNEVTDGGQELIGYYKEGQIQKITYYIGLSFVNTTYEFYFYENKLIFVFKKQKTFARKKNNEFDVTKLVPIFEGRYYFFEEKLFRIKETGNKIFAKEEKRNDLLSKSKSFINELKYTKK